MMPLSLLLGGSVIAIAVTAAPIGASAMIRLWLWCCYSLLLVLRLLQGLLLGQPLGPLRPLVLCMLPLCLLVMVLPGGCAAAHVTCCMVVVLLPLLMLLLLRMALLLL